MNRKLRRVLGTGVAVASVLLVQMTHASAAVTSSVLADTYRTCVWKLGPGSTTTDPWHSPQTLIKCVDGTSATSITLPCGSLVQIDPYGPLTDDSKVKLAALEKAGVQNNSQADAGIPLGGSGYYASIVKTKACVTDTPTPSETPTTPTTKATTPTTPATTPTAPHTTIDQCSVIIENHNICTGTSTVVVQTSASSSSPTPVLVAKVNPPLANTGAAHGDLLALLGVAILLLVFGVPMIRVGRRNRGTHQG